MPDTDEDKATGKVAEDYNELFPGIEYPDGSCGMHSASGKRKIDSVCPSFI